MSRLTRLTNILLQLQSGRLVTAGELANKFKITRRTVYRDIRALEEAGVPVAGEAGKGYLLADGYRIPPVMFSQDELNALVTAQHFLQGNPDRSLYKNLENVLAKIRAIIRSSEKANSQKLENRIHIFSEKNKKDTNLISSIQTAIVNSQVVRIKYHSIHSGELSERDTEPLGIYFTKGNWIMIAHCRLRNDIREFRVDRIMNFIIGTEVFPERQFHIEEYFRAHCEK